MLRPSYSAWLTRVVQPKIISFVRILASFVRSRVSLTCPNLGHYPKDMFIRPSIVLIIMWT